MKRKEHMCVREEEREQNREREENVCAPIIKRCSSNLFAQQISTEHLPCYQQRSPHPGLACDLSRDKLATV